MMQDFCDEHGLYLYRDGSVLTCKLGCVYQIKEQEDSQ
jgi:hypothetical protein